MKKLLAIVLVAFGFVYYGSTVYPKHQVVAVNQSVNQAANQTVQIPDNLRSQIYPNPKLTPGKFDTQDADALQAMYGTNCPSGKKTCTYSESHRNVSQATKDAVCNEYPDNCKGVHEIDHFCAVALGCSNDIKNLWAQPEHVIVGGQDWGFHTKDKLEAFLVKQVKENYITPQSAQECLTQDWVVCYKSYFSGGFGSVVGASEDSDDLIE